MLRNLVLILIDGQRARVLLCRSSNARYVSNVLATVALVAVTAVAAMRMMVMMLQAVLLRRVLLNEIVFGARSTHVLRLIVLVVVMTSANASYAVQVVHAVAVCRAFSAGRIRARACHIASWIEIAGELRLALLIS